MGVTIDDAQAIAATLPRSYEALRISTPLVCIDMKLTVQTFLTLDGVMHA